MCIRDSLMGQELPEDIRLQAMDITMTRYASGNGEATQIHSLDHEIGLTVDLTSELRGYRHYAVMRLHEEDQATLIPPDITEDQTRLTVRTDRFSDYVLLCSNQLLVPAQKPEGGPLLSIQDRPEPVIAEASGADAGTAIRSFLQYHWILWVILLLALILALIQLWRLHKENKRRKRNLARLKRRIEQEKRKKK